MKETIDTLTSVVSKLSNEVISCSSQLNEIQNKVSQETSKLGDIKTNIEILSNKELSLKESIIKIESDLKVRIDSLNKEIEDKTRIIESLVASSELISTERNKIIEPMEGLRLSVLDITSKVNPFLVETSKFIETSKKAIVELNELADTKMNEANTVLLSNLEKEVSLDQREQDLIKEKRGVDRVIEKLRE